MEESEMSNEIAISRAEAIKTGALKYRGTKPCISPSCMGKARYTDGDQCVNCRDIIEARVAQHNEETIKKMQAVGKTIKARKTKAEIKSAEKAKRFKAIERLNEDREVRDALSGIV